MESSRDKSETMGNRGYRGVRLVVALLLLVASALKCYQLSTGPVVEAGLLHSRWFLMATVEFELFFAIWLLTDKLPRVTWAVALCCFALFTGISLDMALSGRDSCGCFGRVRVNPWCTAALDLAIVLSLLRWRPLASSSRLARGNTSEGVGSPRGASRWMSLLITRPSPLFFLWLFLSLPATFAMGSYHDSLLSDAGQIVGNGEMILLNPEKWIGKRFPLLPHILGARDPTQSNGPPLRTRLEEGRWLVMLYHHDCPKCQAAVQNLPKAAREANVQQVALIAMPPEGTPDTVSASLPSFARGRLDPSREWFAETPVVITLQDATTIRVDRWQ